MVVSIVAAFVFVIVVLANAQIMYMHLRSEEKPSFIMVVGPVAGCIFLAENPWYLSEWRWLFLFLDISVSILPFVLISYIGKLIFKKS